MSSTEGNFWQESINGMLISLYANKFAITVHTSDDGLLTRAKDWITWAEPIPEGKSRVRLTCLTCSCPQQDRFVSSEHAEEFKEAILRTIKHWDQNAKIEEEKSGRIVVSLNKDRSVGSLYEEYKSSAEPLFHRGS